MMQRSHRWILFLLAGWLCACQSDDTEKDPDAQLAPDKGIQPDMKPNPDEPFGRACKNVGELCPEKHRLGFPLWCIMLQGSSPGTGYCTPQCSDLGQECYEVPNGQWAQCFIQDGGGDAGPGTKYCGFICKYGGLSWTCPPTLKCPAPDGQGTAYCLP